eukprot:SAG11_NODE_826_length_6982_cov_4.139038_4_plen_157_part_00
MRLSIIPRLLDLARSVRLRSMKRLRLSLSRSQRFPPHLTTSRVRQVFCIAPFCCLQQPLPWLLFFGSLVFLSVSLRLRCVRTCCMQRSSISQTSRSRCPVISCHRSCNRPPSPRDRPSHVASSGYDRWPVAIHAASRSVNVHSQFTLLLSRTVGTT